MKPALFFAFAALSCTAVQAQNLFLQQQAPMPTGTEGQRSDAAQPLYNVSLTAVVPPAPRAFKLHDLVTIIVEETSKQSADQETKADKTYSVGGTINGVIDPWQLLQARLQSSSLKDLELLKAAYNQKYDGKGNYSRNDSFSMKIQAEIIDVKPNGTLTIEARKTIDKNGESQMTVLSGVCRIADITQNNSVLSSQIAELTLVTKNDGEVNKAGKKGLIPRVLDAIFSF
jgi:flagellar L-ring protein precursor FlgH